MPSDAEFTSNATHGAAGVTKILICIGHFSVEILGNVLFYAFLQVVQQTVNILR